MFENTLSHFYDTVHSFLTHLDVGEHPADAAEWDDERRGHLRQGGEQGLHLTHSSQDRNITGLPLHTLLSKSFWYQPALICFDKIVIKKTWSGHGYINGTTLLLDTHRTIFSFNFIFVPMFYLTNGVLQSKTGFSAILGGRAVNPHSFSLLDPHSICGSGSRREKVSY